MPELPDVEGFRRVFRRHAAGKRVERLAAEDEIVRNTTPQGLGRAITGTRLQAPERHGKWLVCPVDGSRLVLHFGMTGELVWSPGGADRHQHDRLVLLLEDGELAYRTQRKLGGVWLARAGQDLQAVTGPLGPDALRVSSEGFAELLHGRRGGVKSALMDQETIAGLGNLTVDEILWRAKVDPRRRTGDLDQRDVRGIHREAQDVLRASVDHGRVPASRSWLTGQRGRDEPRCPRCRTGLETPTVAGRTTYLCPRCQG